MKDNLDIQHTVVFSRNLKAYENGKRFICNQGGSRSSKTYSIIQLLIYLCLVTPKLQVSVVRKSFPALRGSVLRDFVEIMNELGLYDINNHNKTEQRYIFSNKASIEFFSIDDSQKVRGRKRDICYCNEGNELTREDYLQLNMRTSKCLFIDFNPSDDEHYLYELMKEDNAILIKSTYLDNIYLSEDIKKEIANLINVDENYYKIYALGERPIPNTRIYTHFRQIELMPPVDDWCYGIDFGYNHPTCLLKISWSDGNVYVKEELYKSNLTSQDIIKEMNNLGIDKKKYCFADYARPEIIEDLRRAGYNMKEAVKDVKEGIMSVKMNKIFVDKTSLNVWKEFKMYSWKTNKEQILDEPVKLYDDAMDALRYAIYTTEKRGRYDKKYVGFF
jgi:phage terminase large subunit